MQEMVVVFVVEQAIDSKSAKRNWSACYFFFSMTWLHFLFFLSLMRLIASLTWKYCLIGEAGKEAPCAPQKNCGFYLMHIYKECSCLLHLFM